MHLGVPKEIKVHEYRVGMTPASVREVIAHGHQVTVQTMAGHAIGLEDDDYRQAGAAVVETAAEVFATAEMIVKVKEPQASEIAMLRPGQILFTYLHLAPDPDQTKGIDAGLGGQIYAQIEGIYRRHDHQTQIQVRDVEADGVRTQFVGTDRVVVVGVGPVGAVGADEGTHVGGADGHRGDGLRGAVGERHLLGGPQLKSYAP